RYNQENRTQYQSFKVLPDAVQKEITDRVAGKILALTAENSEFRAGNLVQQDTLSETEQGGTRTELAGQNAAGVPYLTRSFRVDPQLMRQVFGEGVHAREFTGFNQTTKT